MMFLLLQSNWFCVQKLCLCWVIPVFEVESRPEAPPWVSWWQAVCRPRGLPSWVPYLQVSTKTTYLIHFYLNSESNNRVKLQTMFHCECISTRSLGFSNFLFLNLFIFVYKKWIKYPNRKTLRSLQLLETYCSLKTTSTHCTCSIFVPLCSF